MPNVSWQLSMHFLAPTFLSGKKFLFCTKHLGDHAESEKFLSMPPHPLEIVYQYLNGSQRESNLSSSYLFEKLLFPYLRLKKKKNN